MTQGRSSKNVKVGMERWTPNVYLEIEDTKRERNRLLKED